MLKETSELILKQVQHNVDCGKDDKFTIKEIEDILQKRVVNILEPENVYEQGKEYPNLGKYIGVINEYPHGKDYFNQQHYFSQNPVGKDVGRKCNTINKIFIKKIKRTDQ